MNKYNQKTLQVQVCGFFIAVTPDGGEDINESSPFCEAESKWEQTYGMLERWRTADGGKML